jgi:hypothetical protein
MRRFSLIPWPEFHGPALRASPWMNGGSGRHPTGCPEGKTVGRKRAPARLWRARHARGVPEIVGLLFFLLALGTTAFAAEAQEGPLVVRVFIDPHCSSCHRVMEDIIPPLARKYKDQVRWDYLDISKEDIYKQYISWELKLNRRLGTPTVIVGNRILVGMSESADHLDVYINEALSKRTPTIHLEGKGTDLLERFKSFGPLAVIMAGLIDGFNPCAFTVIVFFISFLTVMGYRRREMALIGMVYITAVFLTYLGLGFGLFNALYRLKGFFILSKALYGTIGVFSLALGVMALKDYVVYKRTGKTDEMALQLPRPVKDRIHAIVGAYYRKDPLSQERTLKGLVFSAMIVGFLISLLEAVCTGQMYLPTIVFVLKDPSLRLQALLYLVVYNVMFIIPLVVVLGLALLGATSKDFEAAARRNLGLIKLSMAALFFVLGALLLSSFM